jgi:hypothetical protein
MMIFMDASIKQTRPSKTSRIATDIALSQCVPSNHLSESTPPAPIILKPINRYQPHIEEIKDIDAPTPSYHSWNGEESFWMHEDAEFSEGWEAEDEGHGSVFIEDGVGEESMFNSRCSMYVFPPSCNDAAAAFKDITNILKPPRGKGYGSKDSGLDCVTRTRLEGIRMLLATYTRLETDNPGYRGNWTEASNSTVTMRCESQYIAKKLRVWAHAFIQDRNEIPENQYGQGNKSAIDDDDLAQDIHVHLQGIGKYVKAEDIVQYCAQPEMLARLKRTKTISLATARRWLEKMGYRWKRDHRGLYIDGHECADVVSYRQNVFLPMMKQYQCRMRAFTEEHGWDLPPQIIRAAVGWVHDETIFYAHDRRQTAWYHKDATPMPYTKGEGVSLMIADFVSADYGWLRSPDGKDSARVIFRPGKNREGYFMNDDILTQVDHAMTILSKYYPDEDHFFLYDNATTHLSRSADSLSALKMPKNPSKPETNFGVLTNLVGANGRPLHGPDGKLLKHKVQMRNGQFNGGEQELYFPEGHEKAGLFKGMAIILTERGYNVADKRAQCGKKFSDCPEGSKDCCCRRMIYSEPDFVEEEALLETCCRSRGYPVHFFPKFHCETSFIEQCWGNAKRRYRLLAPSSKEEELERNCITSLDAVPLISMRR